MGISTSGAALLIFASILIAVGTLHSTATAALGQVQEAEADLATHIQALHETRINITKATFDDQANTLSLRIKNIGDTTLDTSETTVLVDGQFMALDSFETQSVDTLDSRRWGPTANFTLEDTDGSVLDRISDPVPDRVKIVTGTGVAEVSGVITV